MAIKFNVHKTPQPKSRKGKVLSHARAIPCSTKKMDDICNLICARGSISSADVKAVLDSFVWMIGLALEHGEHVELEELGHFSPSIRTQKQPDGKFAVTVDGVNFRCSETLKKKLKHVALKKEATPRSYPLEERKKRMLNYIELNENITTPFYAELNACSYYQAAADLKRFVTEELIYRVGSRTHVMYLLVNNKEVKE